MQNPGRFWPKGLTNIKCRIWDNIISTFILCDIKSTYSLIEHNEYLKNQSKKNRATQINKLVDKSKSK
jgi:hypothetical protein